MYDVQGACAEDFKAFKQSNSNLLTARRDTHAARHVWEVHGAYHAHGVIVDLDERVVALINHPVARHERERVRACQVMMERGRFCTVSTIVSKHIPVFITAVKINLREFIDRYIHLCIKHRETTIVWYCVYVWDFIYSVLEWIAPA